MMKCLRIRKDLMRSSSLRQTSKIYSQIKSEGSPLGLPPTPPQEAMKDIKSYTHPQRRMSQSKFTGSKVLSRTRLIKMGSHSISTRLTNLMSWVLSLACLKSTLSQFMAPSRARDQATLTEWRITERYHRSSLIPLKSNISTNRRRSQWP